MASSLASWMRWTQKLHFSITPRERTVTSGLSARFSQLVVAAYIEPVEAADLVRAVVGTVSRAHAAVVNLLVQSFLAVHGRQHRADVLAGRVVAVVAEHRLMQGRATRRRRRSNSGRCGSSAFRGCGSTSSRPTTGTLFSAWQAITQAEQPVHLSKSMTIPQRCAGVRMIVRPEFALRARDAASPPD